MQRRNFMLSAAVALATGSFALAGCTTTGNTSNAATDMSKRQSIDASVDNAMAKLYASVKGSRELVAKSRGVLVFPSVIQAGFIVGAQYGEGSLRVGGATVGYYSTASGSLGLQAGGQSKAVIFCFMTQDSLTKFRATDGWAAGADASVALVTVGANGVIDTNTATHPVEVFVLTNAGLMADVSLAGTKVTRLNI
jgi:lipid-binding SYLF domain-containing protein